LHCTHRKQRTFPRRIWRKLHSIATNKLNCSPATGNQLISML
jgi:hypothetical protein